MAQRFGTPALLDVSFAHIFFHLEACVCILLMILFTVQKLLSFNKLSLKFSGWGKKKQVSLAASYTVREAGCLLTWSHFSLWGKKNHRP